MKNFGFILIGSLCFLVVGAHKKSIDSSDSSSSSSESSENDLKLQHQLRKYHKIQRQDNNPAYLPQPIYNLPLPSYPYGGYYNPFPNQYPQYPPQYPYSGYNNPFPNQYPQYPQQYPMSPNQYPQYPQQYPMSPNWNGQFPNQPVSESQPNGIQQNGKSVIDHSLKVNKEYKETGHHYDQNDSGSVLDNRV